MKFSITVIGYFHFYFTPSAENAVFLEESSFILIKSSFYVNFFRLLSDIFKKVTEGIIMQGCKWQSQGGNEYGYFQHDWHKPDKRL
jgi:hypothetical protein